MGEFVQRLIERDIRSRLTTVRSKFLAPKTWKTWVILIIWVICFVCDHYIVFQWTTFRKETCTDFDKIARIGHKWFKEQLVIFPVQPSRFGIFSNFDLTNSLHAYEKEGVLNIHALTTLLLAYTITFQELNQNFLVISRLFLKISSAKWRPFFQGEMSFKVPR